MSDRSIFLIFFNMKVCCVFKRLQCSIDKAILMNTHNTIFNVKGNHLKLSKICSYGIFPRDSSTC